jgi:SAM-dependent methyltransferase
MPSADALPAWASQVLQTSGAPRVEDGVVRIPVRSEDESIAYYRKIGGAHFHERAAVAYAMSSLDTPLYHRYLRELELDPAATVVDVGGGDGRNALPWLERGQARVIVVDAAADALVRLRGRVAQEHPEWLDRLLLIEADARALPLADGCASCVLAIEVLCYLNEDYELGVAQCARLLAPQGRMLLSERDYDGAVLASLLYGGIPAALRAAEAHSMWDGVEGSQVRTRSFTEAQLRDIVERTGLRIDSVHGIPLLSVVLGWMRGQALIGADDEQYLPAVRRLLEDRAANASVRRCNTIVATKR